MIGFVHTDLAERQKVPNKQLTTEQPNHQINVSCGGNRTVPCSDKERIYSEMVVKPFIFFHLFSCMKVSHALSYKQNEKNQKNPQNQKPLRLHVLGEKSYFKKEICSPQLRPFKRNVWEKRAEGETLLPVRVCVCLHGDVWAAAQPLSLGLWSAEFLLQYLDRKQTQNGWQRLCSVRKKKRNKTKPTSKRMADSPCSLINGRRTGLSVFWILGIGERV